MPDDLNPNHAAHPASVPPPIAPWNGFDTGQVNDRSLAVKLVAEILMDDEWHHRQDIIDELADELELPHKSATKLLQHLRSHGDVRADGDWLRLTTRWRGYAGAMANA